MNKEIQNSNVTEGKIDFLEKNKQLILTYNKNRSDITKRNKIKEKRIKRINEYRDEQAATFIR